LEATVKDIVTHIIIATLERLQRDGVVRLPASMPAFTVEPPKQTSHGDFACNVAMVMAKPMGMAPRALAELIVAHVVDDSGSIVKFDIAGPGFLNITLHDRVFHQSLRTILDAGEQWGRGQPTGKRILVEFVSANPTGPVHIGHARGTFVGDAVCRLLHAAGNDVQREFYINDFGKQVETLGRTVHKRYRELFGETITLVEGEYPADYVKDIAKSLRDQDGDRWRTVPEASWLPRCMEVAIAHNLQGIRTTLAMADVRHDVYFSEASLHRDGRVVGVVDVYRQRGVTYEATRAHGTDDKVRRDESNAAHYEDRQVGGTFVKTSAHGDDEDRIILRRDGTPVYLTADLAYHKDKFDRGFDRIIDVFGADHAGHVPRLKAGMHLLGLDEKKLEFVLVQIVRMLRDGQEVKISKRKGTVFELSDLIDEAGADACRFMFLMKTANAQMDFDLDLIEKQSRDNPVFSFQYGHARCAAILRKATEVGQPFVIAAVNDDNLARLTLPEEKALIKKMGQLPDVVAGAAAVLEPHRVLYFCQELISEFHSYYTKYKHTARVVTDDRVTTQGRLAMVAAVKQTLRCAFGIFGIDAPEQMSLPATEAEAEEEA
jgi:arginyl-tRNA synthetase